jgi:Zinc-binding loop region of homing endonuclease
MRKGGKVGRGMLSWKAHLRTSWLLTLSNPFGIMLLSGSFEFFFRPHKELFVLGVFSDIVDERCNQFLVSMVPNHRWSRNASGHLKHCRRSRSRNVCGYVKDCFCVFQFSPIDKVGFARNLDKTSLHTTLEKPSAAKILYRKRSANADAIVFNSLEEYQLSLLYIRDETVEWTCLGAGDQWLEKKYNSLSAEQKKVYHCLVRILRKYITTTVGDQNFDEPGTRFIWNWATWHRIIFNVAKHTDGPGGEKDCWISTLSTDRQMRPKIAVRPGQIEKRMDCNHAYRGKYTFYNIEGSSGRLETTLGRIMTTLANGSPHENSNILTEGSHRCNSTLCGNPLHMVWESSKDNKSRTGCTYSSAFYCPHSPRCIFTNIKGCYLPHRNDSSGYSDCDCPEFNCHTECVHVL